MDDKTKNKDNLNTEAVDSRTAKKSEHEPILIQSSDINGKEYAQKTSGAEKDNIWNPSQWANIEMPIAEAREKDWVPQLNEEVPYFSQKSGVVRENK